MFRHYISFRLIAPLMLLACLPVYSNAQELHSDYQGTWHAEVVEVTLEEKRVSPVTNTEHIVQTIRATVTDGPKAGETITIENDYLQLEAGDKFYFNYNVHIDGTETYGVINIDRRDAVYILLFLFAAAVITLSGWQGVRSLIALAGSFAAIFFLLLPGILAGYNPLLISVLVAAGILFAAIFFTHGLNRESAVAYAGTMLAVGGTSLLAILAVASTGLTGFAEDTSVYLNINTRGTIDFVSLLLGAIIIGVLGVLDDIAITQAAVVTELFNSNRALTRRQVYVKALRVGREHVGALVNTLVLAYTGAALPLLLHYYYSSQNFSMALSTEVFATEIVRTIVGSIGLIMTVPLVTALAVWWLRDYTPKHNHTHGHHHDHGHTH